MGLRIPKPQRVQHKQVQFIAKTLPAHTDILIEQVVNRHFRAEHFTVDRGFDDVILQRFLFHGENQLVGSIPAHMFRVNGLKSYGSRNVRLCNFVLALPTLTPGQGVSVQVKNITDKPIDFEGRFDGIEMVSSP